MKTKLITGNRKTSVSRREVKEAIAKSTQSERSESAKKSVDASKSSTKRKDK
jgi:hypothetical protein